VSWEAGVGAMGTCGGPGAALPFVLTWSLYTGVPSPQGTDSGPQAHPERGCELTAGANILFRVPFPSLVRWDFKVMVQHG
jgi:hypothetical protein